MTRGEAEIPRMLEGQLPLTHEGLHKEGLCGASCLAIAFAVEKGEHLLDDLSLPSLQADHIENACNALRLAKIKHQANGFAVTVEDLSAVQRPTSGILSRKRNQPGEFLGRPDRANRKALQEDFRLLPELFEACRLHAIAALRRGREGGDEPP